MQTIFEKSTNDQIISRLTKLSADTKPSWGKMNAAQMVHHLNLTMEAPLGKLVTKGKPNFFMKMFKSVLYSDKPFGKGSPTPREFKVTGKFNFDQEKLRAIKNIEELFRVGKSFSYRPHVFFGALTADQWGMHFYKHTNHHLSQFGV